MLTLISATAPAVAGQAVYKEPEISRLATIVAMGLVTIFLYDSKTEARFALVSYLTLASLNLIIAHPLHSAIAYLDSTPLTHGPVNELVFKLSTMILLGVIIHHFHRTRRSQQELLEERGQQLSEIQRLKEEAEAARFRAEARLAEIEELRIKERLVTHRLGLTARYEALMRSQYGKPLPDFLRALLEYLQDDLGFVAGLAYQVKDQTYEVVATFALPEHQGRTFSGGLLHTATTLKAPYLVAASRTTPLSIPSLAPLRPSYVLYLPIYPEVAQSEAVAVLELLFLNAPEKERIEILESILPRIGDYLRLQKVA